MTRSRDDAPVAHRLHGTRNPFEIRHLEPNSRCDVQRRRRSAGGIAPWHDGRPSTVSTCDEKEDPYPHVTFEFPTSDKQRLEISGTALLPQPHTATTRRQVLRSASMQKVVRCGSDSPDNSPVLMWDTRKDRSERTSVAGALFGDSNRRPSCCRHHHTARETRTADEGKAGQDDVQAHGV